MSQPEPCDRTAHAGGWETGPAVGQQDGLGQMARSMAFACARGGLAQTLQRGLLGGYDGAGAWVLELRNIRDGDEQLMVETHEGLHHELQASSGLGLISAMAVLLAQRGNRQHALKEFFRKLTDESRQTHELFATTLSASLAGIRQAKAMLRDNPEYLGYLERGLALGGDPQMPWRYRETAAAAVLRCCMAPAGVIDLLALGFGSMSRRSLPVPGSLPDERLAAFEKLGGPATWPQLLGELAADYPDQFEHEQDLDRRQLPADAVELAEVRRFDEEVLLRRCYEWACGILGKAGLPSVLWSEQEQVARALADAVEHVDPELSQRLNVVTERRPVLDDGLEYDRQQVVLREPLPAQITDATTVEARSAFYAEDADGAQHVCGVWLSRKVAEKQFVIPPGRRLPNLVVALLVRARTASGSPVVRLGLLPPSTTPRECQNMLGDVPLLVVTTHYTLTDEEVTRRLRAVEPVFVLMDLPVAWHIDHWIQQGAKVTMALLPLEGIDSAELYMAAFAVSAIPGFRFVCIGGKVGVSILVERLRQRHGDRLVISGEIIRDQAAAFNLMLNHVYSTWHVLDQDAVG
jgi:hypothetical protein